MKRKTNEEQKLVNKGAVLLIPIVGLAIGAGVTVFFRVQQAEYGNLVVNLFFLAATIILLRILEYSKEDIGMKVIPEKMNAHVVFSLAVFLGYLLFYIIVIRISGLRPVNAGMIWGLVIYAVVVLAEEIYFRGILTGSWRSVLLAL